MEIVVLIILGVILLIHQYTIMATLAQLQESISSIETAIASVGTKVSSLETAIASSITTEDSDVLLASLSQVATELQAIASS